LDVALNLFNLAHDASIAHRYLMAANVRLQARAARGASPCKPLFGGTYI
jgi:hypothetical protein